MPYPYSFLDFKRYHRTEDPDAIKFYYEKVLGRRKQYIRISRPRKESRLPTMLTLEEVEKILQLTKNLKHKCILMKIRNPLDKNHT